MSGSFFSSNSGPSRREHPRESLRESGSSISRQSHSTGERDASEYYANKYGISPPRSRQEMPQRTLTYSRHRNVSPVREHERENRNIRRIGTSRFGEHLPSEASSNAQPIHQSRPSAPSTGLSRRNAVHRRNTERNDHKFRIHGRPETGTVEASRGLLRRQTEYEASSTIDDADYKGVSGWEHY